MSRSTLVRRLACTLVGAVALSVAAPAVALPPGGASSDTPGTSASVSPKRVAVGDRLSFTVTGFPAGETVYVKIDDGTACDEAAVHGACVYHQQRISSSGRVSGSFTVPRLAAGQHWLRFLASAPIMRDGKQVGIEGYTARGSSDFTVVAASTGSPTSQSKGSAASGTSAGTTPDGAPTVAGDTAEQQQAAGGVVKVLPRATATPTPTPTPAPSPTPTVAPVGTAVQPASEASSFPWIGALGFLGLVVLSFVGTRLTLGRRA